MWSDWRLSLFSGDENKERKWFHVPPVSTPSLWHTPDSTIWARPSSSLATKHTHLSVSLLLSHLLCSLCCILVFPQVGIDRIISPLWCGDVQRVTIWKREKGRRERGGKTAHYCLTFDPQSISGACGSTSSSLGVSRSLPLFLQLRVVLEDLQYGVIMTLLFGGWMISSVCWKDSLTPVRSTVLKDGDLNFCSSKENEKNNDSFIKFCPKHLQFLSDYSRNQLRVVSAL